MDSYQRLTAALPERPLPERVHRVSAKAIAGAAAGLPLANPAQAVREVEQMLDRMAGVAAASGERIAALEHLRAPVASLCASAERLVGPESQPLSPAAAAWAATAQRLTEKLALGYALGVHELCAPAGRLPRFKGRLVATGVVRGLVHAIQALGWSCRQYHSPAAGTWRRMHALYAFASELALADQGVEDSVADGVLLNARDAYAHALLLALSNPYRFSAAELQQTWHVCRCLAQRVGLARAGAAGMGVDIASDAGPGYVPAARLGVGGAVLAIDLALVKQVLDERVSSLPAGVRQLDFAQSGSGRVVADVALVQRLRAGWDKADRGYPRLGATHRLDVVIGMHGLHYVLAGELDFATFVRQVRSQAGVGAGRTPVVAWPDVSGIVRPQLVRSEVLDQSNGGYRLRLPLSAGCKVRVGDLIGLTPVADDVDGRSWMVGVVRWLRRTDGEPEAFLGVELLRREARAAGVLARTSDGAELAPVRAVEFSDNGDDAQLSLLVARPFAGNVAAAEVALPALASDWNSRAAIVRWRLATTEALGAACFRVTLDGATRQGDV